MSADIVPVTSTETTLSPDSAVLVKGAALDLINQIEVTTNKKGNTVKKPIFMFLRSWTHRNEEGVAEEYYYTIITSIFRDDAEQMAYMQSLATKRIVNGVFAVNQGAYRFRLLEELCNRRDFHFRGVMMESKDLQVIDYIARAEKVTVAWATDSKGFFLSIVKFETDEQRDYNRFNEDCVVKEFGLTELGLIAEYVKKLTKRNQEVFRSSDRSIFINEDWGVLWTNTELVKFVGREYFQDPFEVVCAEFKTPQSLIDLYGKSEADKLFDGISFVDAKLVLRALHEQFIEGDSVHNKKVGNKIFWFKNAIKDAKINGNPFVDRFIFRGLGELGLVKGDCIAMIDLKINTGMDVIFHTENLKRELRTDGWTIFTFETHSPKHSTTLDSWTTINLAQGITMEVVTKSTAALIDYAKGKVGEDDPDWMKFKPENFNDDFGVAVSKTVYEQGMSDVIRWQAYSPNLTSEMSQNFGAMKLGFMDKQMTRFLNPKTGLNKKPWIPALNAVSMGVLTDAALLYMVGFDSGADTAMVYVENVGIVYPDHRWLECYELAGGQDEDDNNNAMDERFWCSNAAHLKNLQSDGVIDPAIILPTTPEEALAEVDQNLALFWRMPNGPGEYSIQRYKGKLPFMNVDPSAVVLVDVAKLPRGQKHLLSKSRITGLLDDSREYSTSEKPIFFGLEHAKYILEAQSNNPGIGGVAIALMAWTNTMGPSYPPVMADKLEELVDAVKAGHDKVAIAGVVEAADQILNQLAKAISNNPALKVDRLLVTERLRGNTGDYMKVLRANMEDRRPTKTSKIYMAANREIKNLIKTTLLQGRAATPLYRVVKSMKFDLAVEQWARIRFNTYTAMLREIDRVHQIHPKDPTFLKMTKRMARSEEAAELMAKFVEELQREPELTDLRVTALYQIAIRGNRRWPLGFYDRPLFQSAGNEVAVFDLFAQALLKYMP